ncbi:MAG: DNA primase [bacterium]|nr:DNA primase [bacterium]
MVGADLNPQVTAQVRDASDMLEVVGDHVRLKRRGRSWLGLCPFHEEKTPSFTVDPTKGLYYCFGCHAGGDIINFVMRLEHLGFPEAVEQLAQRFGVQLPARSPDARRRRQEIDTIRALLDEAQKWFTEQLASGPGRRAREELARRGFDPDSWATYGFGFAPDDWRCLLQALHSRHTESALIKAGLVVAPDSGGRPYDRFRNRLMFPIRSADGRLLAFGGRIIGDGEPKYLNSPEGPTFQKRSTLFALDLAKRAIADEGTAIVVEGYFDCLSLHRVGVKNVVATLGTALTTDHSRLLKRLAEKVLLCYDGDQAGRRAATTGSQVLLQTAVDVGIITLPSGKDPDDLIREEGSSGFTNLLAQPTGLLDFMLEDVAQDRDTRRRRGLEIAELVGSARDAVTKFALFEDLARRLDLPLEVLREHSGSIGPTRPRPAPTPIQSTQSSPGEDQLLRMLLVCGAEWRRKVLEAVEPQALENRLIAGVFENCSNSNFDLDVEDEVFIRALHDGCEHAEHQQLIARISLADRPEATPQALEAQLKRLLQRQVRGKSLHLLAKIREAEAAGDTDRVADLQQQKLRLLGANGN